MLSELAVSGYVLPPPTLEIEPGLRSARLDVENGNSAETVDWSKTLAGIRSKLQRQRDQFDKLYREAERLGANPNELRDLANVVYAQEQNYAKILVPQIEWLRAKLTALKSLSDTARTRSLRQGMEGWLDLVATWLELYQHLCIRLLKLASDRRRGEDPGSGVLTTDDEVDNYLRRLVAE